MKLPTALYSCLHMRLKAHAAPMSVSNKVGSRPRWDPKRSFNSVSERRIGENCPPSIGPNASSIGFLDIRCDPGVAEHVSGPAEMVGSAMVVFGPPKRPSRTLLKSMLVMKAVESRTTEDGGTRSPVDLEMQHLDIPASKR